MNAALVDPAVHALCAALPQSLHGDTTTWASSRVQHGFTVAAVERLQEIAAWAVGGDTLYARAANHGDPTGDTFLTMVCDLDGLLRDYGRTVLSAGLGWVAVAAGAPSHEASTQLHRLLGRFDAEHHRVMQEWVTVGEIGPLAWAAGLTVAEARQAHAAGAVDLDALQVLVGLRGWMLP